MVAEQVRTSLGSGDRTISSGNSTAWPVISLRSRSATVVAGSPAKMSQTGPSKSSSR
jgi:hypothetical protein